MSVFFFSNRTRRCVECDATLTMTEMHLSYTLSGKVHPCRWDKVLCMCHFDDALVVPALQAEIKDFIHGCKDFYTSEKELKTLYSQYADLLNHEEIRQEMEDVEKVYEQQMEIDRHKIFGGPKRVPGVPDDDDWRPCNVFSKAELVCSNWRLENAHRAVETIRRTWERNGEFIKRRIKKK